MIRPLCRLCHAWCHAHPTLHGWIKCRSCGYCKKEYMLITIEDYCMGRREDDRYKDEWNDEIEANAKILLDKVNALLNDLSVHDCAVSSGWRPPQVNEATKGAATHSNHMIGRAVDLHDTKQTLYNQILKRNDLLEKYGLMMEDCGSTPTWVHLDTAQRSDRTPRTFKP